LNVVAHVCVVRQNICINPVCACRIVWELYKYWLVVVLHSSYIWHCSLQTTKCMCGTSSVNFQLLLLLAIHVQWTVFPGIQYITRCWLPFQMIVQSEYGVLLIVIETQDLDLVIN